MEKNRHSAFKRLLSLLLVLSLLMSLVPAPTFAAGASSLLESLNDEYSLENYAIHVDVSKESGAFYIRTVNGDKLVKGDENANLLWPSEDDTSFTTVRITRNGTTNDYIFGKDYGSGSSAVVSNDGTQIVAVWTVEDITFTQVIALQPSNNDAHGMVVISYTAQNSGEDADIAIRVLLDTAMGSKDYAYYNVEGLSAPVETERELGEDGYNKSIYMMDDPSDPLVTGYILNGSVDGAESKPVKTIFAHWANLASTVYDYTPDGELCFTNPFNGQHLTSDSAVALYYDLGSIESDHAGSIQMNYGLYSNEKVDGYSIAVNLQTIDELTFTDETESQFTNDGIFTARTILQNASRKTFRKVRIYAFSSDGIKVLNSSNSETDESGTPYGYDHPYYVEIDNLVPGQKVNDFDEWHFKAEMDAMAQYGRIHFKAYDMTGNEGDAPLESDLIGEAKKYILIPGSKEKLPNVQLTGSAPDAFYTEGHRVLSVTGMRFEGLEAEADNRYTMKLARKDGGVIRNGQTTLELTDSVSFNNGTQGSTGMMNVTVDGDLPEGEYKLTVDYTDPDREDVNAKALEFQVVDDPAYRRETYGLVVVYHDGHLSEWGCQDYLVETFNDEYAYRDWLEESGIEESDIYMIFKGVFDDLTDALPDGAESSLESDEHYARYIKATLPEDGSNVVTMSDALKFTYYEAGSNVLIKQICKYKPDDHNNQYKNSVKVDFNCSVSTTNGMAVYSGISCFTELKADRRYRLVEYDKFGERDDTAENTIALIWDKKGLRFLQYIAGVYFDLRYAELGIMLDDEGRVVARTVGFGAGLDLSCIIPKSADKKDDSSSQSSNGGKKLTADQTRAANEKSDIRKKTKSFSQKNKDRAEENVANGFYDDDDFYAFSGSVQVSDILFGQNTFLGFNLCVGVGIPPLGEILPKIEGTFMLRTIGQGEFNVNGSAAFSDFELEVLLDMKANENGIMIPDEFKFFIGGITPGTPLDPWGIFWLQGGGGGIKDIYETIYLQDKLPPLKIILQAQFSLMQLMVGKATLEVGLTGLGVALSDVKIKATDVGIMDSGVIALRWYPNIAAIGSVQLDLLDTVQGGGYLVLYSNYDGSNFFLELFARAALHLPEKLWVIGGITVGEVDVGVSTERLFGGANVLGIGIGFSYYWTNEFDWGMRNEASPTFPELLGLGQEFDTDIDEMFENIPTGDEGEEGSSSEESAASALGLEAVPVYYDKENHRTLMAVAGTNFDAENTVVVEKAANGRVPQGDNQQKNVLSISPDGRLVEAKLANNGKNKIVLLTWDSASMEEAKVEAAGINSGAFPLVMADHDKDMNEQKTANANLSYDAETKKAMLAVVVTDSSVNELNFSSSIPLDAALYDVNDLPALGGCSSTLNGDSLTVNLAGTSIDEFDYVNVGLIEESELEAANSDNSYVPNIVLAGQIVKNSETGRLPISSTLQLPVDLRSGNYVVRLTAQDEAQTQISRLDLTDTVINFVNPNTPVKPVAIGEIRDAGDWKVNIPINAGTAGSDNGFDGYMVTVTDADGASVPGLTDMMMYKNGEMVDYSDDGKIIVPEVNNDKGHVVIGGRYEMTNIVTDGEESTDGKQQSEMPAETRIAGFSEGSYSVSVRKWKAVDGIPVYSEALSRDFTVSEPTPATVSITGSSKVNRKEERLDGGEVVNVNVPYYKDSQLQFTLTSDKAVTGSWVIDGQSDTDGYHGTVENVTSDTIDLRNAGLADGVHTLSFTGTTAGGDSSFANYVFGLDNQAPEIQVSSPVEGGTFDAGSGQVIITGVTDPGAALTFYDQTTGETLKDTPVTMNPETGDFTATVTLSGNYASHRLMMSAADDLGNSNERGFTLLNSRLGSVESLHIYEGNKDWTEKTLPEGTREIKLVGKTSSGDTVEFNDPSMVEWGVQTLEGKQMTLEPASNALLPARVDTDIPAGTVGIITGRLLVNDTGAYPVSCTVGSSILVSSDAITLEEDDTAPISVSSLTGTTLTYESANETVATVQADNEGIAIVTGHKAGTTTITVTTSTGETATVSVVVTNPKTHTVTFDYDRGDSYVETLVVEKGGYAEAPMGVPTREGYKFLGWYLVLGDGSLEESAFDFANVQIYEDTTIKAKWAAEVTLNTSTSTVDATGNAVSGPASEDITVAPSGQLYEGDDVTVTAPVAPGCTFNGWYDNEDKVGENLGYNFTIEGNKTLTARYTANNTVNVTIDCGTNTFTVNGSTKSGKIMTPFRLGSTITVEVTSDGEFMEWENDYGMVLSRERSYTFTVTGTTKISAVFNTSLPDKATLVFKSDYGQIRASDQLGLGETMVIPSMPEKNGYDPLGWDLNGDGKYDAAEDTLESAISRGLAAENHIVTIMPVYQRKDASYTVTVHNGTGGGSYQQNTVVTVTADAAPDGKKFSHWKDDSDGETLGYNKTYAFYAEKDISLTAVYADDAEAVEAKGTTDIVNITYNASTRKLSFVSMSTVPEGCKIQKAGLLTTTDAEVANGEFDETTAKYVRGNATEATSYRYTWTKTNVNSGDPWYARGYLVYTDANGNQHSVYGKVVDSSGAYGSAG